jgi:hypothetical protein
MSGNSQQNPMKFPKLPDDLSIGNRTLHGQRSVVFKGIISSEHSSGLGIPPGNVKIAIHDKGIRLEDEENKAVLDIHNAQLAGMNIETQVKSLPKKQSGILKTIYKVLAFITLGAMVGDLADESATYTKEVTYLVINFWNPNSETTQQIFVSSRKKRVEKFIALFN